MPVPLDRLDLARGVVAAFTGRTPRDRSSDPAGDPADASGLVDPANLAHHRPHVPALLASARRSVAQQLGIEVDDLHLMRQVHGADVATLHADAARGIEVRDVDALVTDQAGRALVTQAADCVPLLAAVDDGPVGAAHAGRAGVQQGVVPSLVDALGRLGATPDMIHLAVGPAIGGCCYEVPAPMVDEVSAALEPFGRPAVEAVRGTTSWGTPSLDLPAAVVAVATALGVADVRPSPGCTRCEDRWFSHRRDAASGRHWGVVLRTADAVHGQVAA